MHDSQSLPLAKMPMQTREQWIKLIYIILYSNSMRADYTLIGPKRARVCLEKGAVEVPALIVKKKEGSR